MIKKSLQINSGSYGVLSIDDFDDGQLRLTEYKYTQAAGKHEHINLYLSPRKAMRLAIALYQFSIGVPIRKDWYMMCHRNGVAASVDPNVYLVADRGLNMRFGRDKFGFSFDAQLIMTSIQARQVACILFYWASIKIMRKKRVRSASKLVLDICDD